MKRLQGWFVAVLVASVVLTPGAAYATDKAEVAKAIKDAQRAFHTKVGHAYVDKFFREIAKSMVDAMHACSETDTKTALLYDIVFIVSADSHIERVVSEPQNRFARCISSNLRLPAKVSRPPRDSWPVQLHVINRPREKAQKPGEPDYPAVTFSPADEPAPVISGPPDKPIKGRGQQQLEELERALAPYIAQARASYPAAKKKFLAGLPPNHRFSVWIRLYQNDKKSKEFRHEDVFVAVESIKKGIVTGRINNTVQLVTDHHEGERISFPESEVNNWLILRPDGTEEGNPVGKFLDHYKPR